MIGSRHQRHQESVEDEAGLDLLLYLTDGLEERMAIMADNRMMAQMSSKDGFIAALDQSGGSTPGALRLYGIPDSGYDGEAQMFKLMHEFRVRILSHPLIF